MKTLQLIVVIFLGRIPLHDACAPNQGFFAISNKPAKGRKPGDFFVYAIHTGSISSLDEIEFRKDDLGLTCDLTLTGEIRTSYSYLWGCYLQLGTPDKDKASRFGTFTVTHSSGESVNTFIRRKTKLLDTKGVYTITVYPKAIGSTELAESGDNSIGIVCKYNCHTIEWFKGNKRLNNTGPQMTISSTEDAGVYTIRRRNRAMKHWFVQIEVIVASCPLPFYMNRTTWQCTERSRSLACANGGVPKNEEDACTCPPYYIDSDCGLPSVDAQGFSPTQGFYVITNQPSRGPNSGNLYLYAITTSRLTSGDEVEFTKSEYGLPRSLVKTGVIPATSDYIWGCFLKVGQPNRYKGIRYGTYTVTSADKSGTRSINTFVRPKTKILNPEGTFSVTVYPKAIGSTDLAPSDYNPIGVAWTPGCQNIRWCKGKRRNINTGPRLTLTSTEDAGIYTIQRRSRKRKGQFVQIEVIVASCPQGLYLSGGACLVRSNYPCENGGVEKDDRDVCICPPFFATNDCSEHIDVPEEPYGLTFADASRNLFCGNLNGGNTKCKGFLFCPGELFGCKCFPGWFGNNCDIGCPKGKWGIACSLTCPAGNKQCNRFDGSNTPE